MNSQEKKEIFLKEKAEYDGEIHHIFNKMEEITNPSLIEIDDLYGIVTGLSRDNAKKYRKIILWLSIIGGILTWSFLFYDEAEMHGLIVACTVSIIILYFIKNYAEKMDCHRKYLHENAIKRKTPKYENEKRLERVALIITICTYAFTLIVEVFIFYNYLANYNVNMIRAGLKIIIGTAALFALFAANYYGKMSLYDNINDSKRMVLLYNEFEKEVDKEGGVVSEENIKFLAREFLIENSTWYASQKTNKPDWVM